MVPPPGLLPGFNAGVFIAKVYERARALGARTDTTTDPGLWEYDESSDESMEASGNKARLRPRIGSFSMS